MTRLALLAAAAFLLSAGAGWPQEGKMPEAAPKDDATARHKEDVVRLRGLEFKSEVTVGSYSKQELLEFLKAEFEKDLPKEKLARFQRGYAKFGLVPADMDLHEAYLELLGSAIAGFYHPKTKQLRLVKPGEEGGSAEEEQAKEQFKKMGVDMDKITLVHELTHAAQDQNFELSTLPLEDETNDDMLMAIKAVVEGDASVVGWKYGLKFMFDMAIGPINEAYKTGMFPGKAGQLPAYMRKGLTFPYGHGTDFVMAYLKETKGSFKDLSKLYQDFPLSSEQILHPEKYTGERDNPTLVTLPDLAALFGPPWKESFHNVHGEFYVKLLLDEFHTKTLTEERAARAAEGWDGDRYVVLEDDKQTPLYVWLSTWDSPEDAREFYEAYAIALEKKYKQPAFEGERKDQTAFTTDSGEVVLQLKDSDVLVLDGVTPAMAAKAPEIWAGVKKVEIVGVERLRKFVCEKDAVKEAFSGKCPKCGGDLKFKDEEKGRPEKLKKRDYSLRR